MKKYPKTVFVAWDGDDEPYLMADGRLESFAEIGTTRRVAIYELKRMVNIKAE